MNDAIWVHVARCELIPPREGRSVSIGDHEIAIFNLGEDFLATDNQCPHKGGPLCDGIITGRSVVCPLHAWKINLETGAVDRPGSAGACVRTYPVRVEDGIVTVLAPAGVSQAEKLQDCQIVEA
jgi:nitrite reductase (NADH) small subunit